MIKTIAHEFSRCEIAFESFKKLKLKRNRNSDLKLKLYNSYSLFITHLYEYLKACFRRDFKEVKNKVWIDKQINYEAEKAQNYIKNLKDRGKAPNGINDIIFYKDKIPENFGEDYRAVRNNFGHADYRRVYNKKRPSLTEFYKNYHGYILALYFYGIRWWEIKDVEELNVIDIDRFNDNI